MQQAAQECDILIVGAGLCGLMAASQLIDSGRTVTLVDKGRSVGGRLATRRLEQGQADTGAQFFTVRDGQFRAYVDQWLEEGIVFQWSTGWSDGSVNRAGSDGHPRYAVRSGMNALAKHIAAQLEASPAISIATGVRIETVRHQSNLWLAEADDGRCWRAQTLVLTAPVPQSIALLAEGGIALPDICQQELGPLAYAPCLCGIYRVEGGVTLPEPGALQQPRLDITWIADNERKGVSSDATVVTVHGGPDFSRDRFSEPDYIVEPLLRAALTPYLDVDARIVEAQVKRWRYALPVVLYPQRYLKALDLPSLYFGGDAFGGPRVEGAALSGMTIGRLLAEEKG